MREVLREKVAEILYAHQPITSHQYYGRGMMPSSRFLGWGELRDDEKSQFYSMATSVVELLDRVTPLYFTDKP